MFKKQLLVLFLATLASHSLWAAQFARPIATTDAGAWTVTGALSHHEALNENTGDFDADYISAGSSSTIVLKLTDTGIVDPNSSTGHILRFRCRAVGGGGQPEYCDAALYEGPPPPTNPTPIASTTNNAGDRNGFALDELTLTGVEADSIGDYTNLYVQLTASVGNGESIDVSWLEFEVPDATASVPPTVTTPTFADVTDTTATLGGNVTDEGSAAVTDRGIEWGTSPGTYTNTEPAATGGAGTFTVPVAGLPSSDVIYFRAYATSTVGTSFSAESSFTTLPTVNSPTIADVTDTTATLGGTVVTDGDVTVDSRGVEWSQSQGGPYTSVPAAAGGAGTFTVPVTGLASSDVIYFRAWATNAGGTSYSAESSFTTTPAVTSPTFAAVTDTTATLGGTVAAGGGETISTRGVEWGTSPGTYPNSVPAAAGGSGTYTVPVTGLPSNTLIYFRAWATNAGGTGTSAESSFTTDPGLPSVDTPTVTSITATTAVLGGTVTSDGGGTVTDRGTVWGTAPNPTGNILSEGSGTGTFSHLRTDLPTGTLVYFRAYATNAAGTAYSADATFTPADLPTVTTPTAVNIGTNSADLGGTVTSDGGAPLTARGTVWNTTGTPVVENALAEGGTTTGTFSHARSGMPSDTTIFYRAYATNSAGTAYSPQSQFLTETAAETQASNLIFDKKAGRSVRLTWTRGSRDGVIVVMRETETTPTLVGPSEGVDYTGNPDFSAPPETTGTGNYVVYKGFGTSVLVTGLTYTTSYSVAVYEYSGTGATSSYLAGPVEAADLTTNYDVHNYDYRANCDDCHNHSSFGARGPELKAVCSGCHNPTGLASARLQFGFEDTWNTTGATTTGHPTPTKNLDIDVVDCGMCHEVHNHTPASTNTTYSTHSETLAEQNNLAFLRANVDKYVPNASPPAYLHTDEPGVSTPDRAVEGGNDTTARGYCQVCHTLTDYHRSSNTAGADQCHDGASNTSCGPEEVTCGLCHDHNNNFEGAGGSCTGCHASPQPTTNPTRPIITTQFDRNSKHIPGGSAAVTQADCEVCHDQTGHPGDQIIGLVNADNATITYEQPTAGASTLATGEGEAFAPACLSCHDSNGASRLPAYAGTSDGQTDLSPFTGVVYDPGPPVVRFPEIDATAWDNSSHDRPIAEVGSTAPMTCVGDGTNGCHGSGHGSEQNWLLAPADVSPASSMADFCFNCHDSDGPSTLDIQSEFAALAALNIGPVTSQGGATTIDNYHDTSIVSCNECHSPHVNNDLNPVADPDTDLPLSTYDPVNGSYTEDGATLTYNSGGNYDPLNPEANLAGGYTEPDYIQFCLTCHDGTTPPGVTMAAGMINIATAYKTDQHGAGNGSTGSKTNKGGLKSPWVNATNDGNNHDPDQNYAAMNCTTCHGAHGTGSIYNLRESITVAGQTLTVGGVGGFLDEAAYAGSTTYTLPLIGGNQTDHYWGAWCTFCHKGNNHPGKTEQDSCTGAHMHGDNSF